MESFLAQKMSQTTGRFKKKTFSIFNEDEREFFWHFYRLRVVNGTSLSAFPNTFITALELTG